MQINAARNCRNDTYKLAATSKKELPYLQTLAGGLMRRREFILHTATGLGAWLASKGLSALPFPTPSLPTKFNAADTIILGKNGITTSRLAMGTGTGGVRPSSHQTDHGRQC